MLHVGERSLGVMQSSGCCGRNKDLPWLGLLGFRVSALLLHSGGCMLLLAGSGVLLVASDLQKPKAEPSTPNRLGLDKTAELIRD